MWEEFCIETIKGSPFNGSFNYVLYKISLHYFNILSSLYIRNYVYFVHLKHIHMYIYVSQAIQIYVIFDMLFHYIFIKMAICKYKCDKKDSTLCQLFYVYVSLILCKISFLVCVKLQFAAMAYCTLVILYIHASRIWLKAIIIMIS